MKIINDYPGSSIEILSNNESENILHLSLKKEHKKYCHYYNFIVTNASASNGLVFIHNIFGSLYFDNVSSIAPYFREGTGDWKKIDKENFYIKNDCLTIKILEQKQYEISLVPRYTMDNWETYLENFCNLNFVTYTKDIIPKLILGNTKNKSIVIIGRQHPGEVLSSFFIEGIIDYIIENKECLNKYCFIFFPFVNIQGVECGNHRYSNNIDYNRCWSKKDSPKEITYIKNELLNYNLDLFIDVHNDEITDIDYLRASFINKSNIANIAVLKDTSKFRNFFRALIKEKKLINIFSNTARNYVSKKYNCNNILVELSMQKDFSMVNELGKNFIKELMEM